MQIIRLKYFGRDKGVTMYTFVDERQALFYSTVFSSSDRADTHGFAEQIISATHFIYVDFAPRFKQIGSQHILSIGNKKCH
ncbi:MAG: Tn3 family transposase [Woeseiaceae bacterium]